MKNYRKILRDLVIETIQEDTEYQKLVSQVMNIIGIDSPTELSDDKKAEFFSYLDSIWDKENNKKRKEPDADELKVIFGESVNESKRYTSKTDALNDFFTGKISAEELSDLATNTFRSPIASKKQLQDFLKNKFLQDMMADTYNLSTSELVKKVKELVDKKLYEGIVTETHWINPQAQQKFARKFKTKKSKLNFTDFPSGDSSPSSKVISGKVELPNGEIYKVDVNWKKGEIVNYVKESLNEKIKDLGKGDTVHVSKENKTGMVLKQYGQKVHVKFPDGKEKTYNHDEVRHIQDENINESEKPIEKVKVGDTVTNPTGGNKRTNPPIFTVDKIEKRKGSRGTEIALHGKDKKGKKQALIRDKGKPVRIEESINESPSPLAKRIYDQNKWGKVIHDKVLKGRAWDRQKVDKFLDDLEEKDPKKWEAAIRSLSHDSLIGNRFKTYGHQITVLLDELAELYKDYTG